MTKKSQKLFKFASPPSFIPQKGNKKWTFAKTKLEIKELFLTYSNKARQHCMRGRRRASKLTQLANKLGQALAFSVQVSVCVFME